MAKSTKQSKRVIIELDFSTLALKELYEVSQALSSLEELGKRGVVRFSMINASKKRGRASPELPPIQPQAKQILEALASNAPRKITAGEIAVATKLKENSVRAHLHTLLKRGLVKVEQKSTEPGSPGRKTINIWSAGSMNVEVERGEKEDK